METNRATTTLKLFTSNGCALTNLASTDETICLPHQIEVANNGKVLAMHADAGDFEYPSLEAFCMAYGLDAKAVRAEMAA